ncbi:ABC transporter permease [Halomicrococcus sp. SG-WS-1]|uniref:ABC transporter permease n=1 Tax=Halomicrococcus sp. SG-WS-1 TaxID=3439057 RepID=UPI003F7B02DE
MTRVLTIARRDLRHVLRDRLVWGAIALLGLMFLPSTASIASSGHREIGDFLLTMSIDLVTFALVVVAAVGYNSVVGERATGTVRTVLGLSGTRRDLVLGKFLGRAAIVVLAMAAVLAVACVLVARGYGNPYLVPFWVMAGWMLAYAVVWTAVTVGYSAAFASQYRTLGAIVVTYATFSPALDVWNVLVRPVFAFALTGSTVTPAYDGLATAPLWLRVTERLNPLNGFFQAMRWSVESVGPGTPTSSIGLQLFGTAVFLCFGAVGLFVGVRRFERTDLCRDGSGSRMRERVRRPLRSGAATLSVVRRASEPANGRSRSATIARADLRHALQQWVVVGAIALFTLLVAPQLWSRLDPNSVSPASDQVASIPNLFGLPIIVLSIAVNYGAVVGERELGTVRLLLGSAGSRRNLVVGKLGARLAVVSLALAPSILFAEVLVATRFGDPFPKAFLAWAGWTFGTGLVWTTFVVGVSTAASSRYRTLAAVFGTYLLFGTGVGLWNPVVRPLFSFLFTGRFAAYESYVYATEQGPLWFWFTDHLNPLVALQTVREGLFILVGHEYTFTSVPLPVFLFSVAISLLFATVPLYTGYRRFAQADLS